MNYVYGPIPSRRLGKSLGISPVEKKACNYSCIYCQLGYTDKLMDERKEFYPVMDIISELKFVLDKNIEYDVISIVGEGEPTLYSELGLLIREIKKLTDKPVCVITNGSKLYDPQVRVELMYADIVLPSLDAYNQNSYRRINNPLRNIRYGVILQGLIDFSQIYEGQIWLEIMLLKDYNDSAAALKKFKKILKRIKYDRLYLNLPVRPPANKEVAMADKETVEKFAEELKAIPIDLLSEEDFYSHIDDDYEAVLSIIRRHPMNQHEIKRFLETRKNSDYQSLLDKLGSDSKVVSIKYKGYKTYRLK